SQGSKCDVETVICSSCGRTVLACPAATDHPNRSHFRKGKLMKLLVATAAACVISCSAFAADIVYDDLPTPPVAPPPLPAKFDWSGAYIGVFGGVTTGDFKYNVSSANFALGLKGSGFIGG